VKYWLCVVNEENWNAVKKRKIWGVPEKRGRQQIEAVKPGDYLTFYVTPKRVGGIFKAVSEPFKSNEKIFSWADFGKEELFPRRVKIEPTVVPKTPIPIDKLLQRLSFSKGWKRWSVYLRRAMLEITKADFELFSSLLSG
jgi:predicted RNA-binding protein